MPDGPHVSRPRKPGALRGHALASLAKSSRPDAHPRRMMQDTGIKLDLVATDMMRRSGRAMLAALGWLTFVSRSETNVSRSTATSAPPCLRASLQGGGRSARPLRSRVNVDVFRGRLTESRVTPDQYQCAARGRPARSYRQASCRRCFSGAAIP